MNTAPPGFFRSTVQEFVNGLADFSFFAAGKFYVLWWAFRFLFVPVLVRVLAMLMASISMALVAKESVGLSVISHVHQWMHPNDKFLHLVAGVILAPTVAPAFFILVAAMELHHHRMMRVVRRRETLVGSLRTLAVSGCELMIARAKLTSISSRAEQEQQEKDFVRHALDEVTQSFVSHDIFSRLKLAQPKVTASVWTTQADDPGFLHRWCDCPEGTYSDVTKLPMNSAAAHALNNGGKLLYVPWAYFQHGFDLRVPKEGIKMASSFDTFVPHRNAFIPVDSRHVPSAAIIIEIIRHSSNSRLILCLDTTKINGFREIDYQVACLIANIFGMATGTAPVERLVRSAESGSG